MRTILLLVILLPMFGKSQTIKNFESADKAWCNDQVELYGFKSVKTERYVLAGEELNPQLTRLITIDLSGVVPDSELIGYCKKKAALLKKIAVEYCQLLLKANADQIEARVIYHVLSLNGLHAESMETYNSKYDK